jgi:hypothetical protein
MRRNLLDQISNGITTAREDGKDMKSNKVRKNLSVSVNTRDNSSPEAALPDDPARRLLADGDGKGGTRGEEEKGCLMCGTCGSVGYCVLDGASGERDPEER